MGEHAQKVRMKAHDEAQKEAAELKAMAKAEALALVETANALKAQNDAEIAALRHKAERDAHELLEAGVRELEALGADMKRKQEEKQFLSDKVMVDPLDVSDEWQAL